MKAIVTGGAGFIGSNLALELEGKGAKVVIIDDFSSARFENLRAFRGDLIAQDINTVAWNKLGRVDVVFHQGACTDTTVTNQTRMMTANFEGLKRIVEYVCESKCKLVYASSAAVYGNGAAPQSENGNLNPLNIYGYSKLSGDYYIEKLLRADRGVRIVGLRYFNVFGMGEQSKGTAASMIYRLSQQMKAGKRPRIFYNGEQSRDHIYVRDVVHANIKAFEGKRSGIVNVGTGKSTTFNRLIEILNDVMGTDLQPDYFDNPYSFYQNETRADTARALDFIGFRSKFNVEDGIRDYFRTLYSLGIEKAVST